VGRIVKQRALNAIVPDRARFLRPVLPEDHRKEILGELALMHLEEPDRTLVEEVQKFCGRDERIIPEHVWREISATLTLRGVTGMSLTPAALKKRHERIVEQMQDENAFLEAVTKQMLTWPIE
jgi:hypothetical protein